MTLQTISRPIIGILVPCVLSVMFWASDGAAPADETSPNKLTAGTFAGLKFRAIGPALMSGRIADIALDPVQPNIWYVAAGSGNLWKTNNAGVTWQPIFDNYGSYSIGCVTVDPSNRHTVWVGTGENVSGRHVGYGDGVYKSLDGGKSFKNVGLKNTEHLSKILVHPRNSNIVYAAAQGPLWSPGGERGLYKTTDGGTSWSRILHTGKYTGVTDIVFDPRNPNILYAATHQRHRTVAALINGGPESGIFKTTDGGRTWKELTSGLPSADKGKIGLAVSPIKPDVVYAAIELAGRTGGFWRSADAGQSWTKMSDYISGGTGPHYYQEIWADPHRFDVVYHANVQLGRTEDGGKTWQNVESPWKHVDNHAVAFHPTDRNFLLVGCDGGLYRSFDYAKTYQYFANLPLTQFYKLSLDNAWPFYNIIGGTQDNNTQHGPSRTANETGIRNSDWFTPIGGDGHDCAIDPQDPNIMYVESQEGFLRRYDRGTGESIDIRPRPPEGEDEYRFNWDSPVYISPHSHTRIYFASQKLFRSDDRGDSWTVISPDLSRGADRFKTKLMDRVWSIDALWDLFAMSQFGNITSITESPLEEGLIYVGTDDGLIHVTENGGESWRKIDNIVGLPDFAFVNDVKADLHDKDTVYAVFDHHKTGDFQPYLFKSTDRGRTWSSIAGDLPKRQILWRIVQDHKKKDLLFVGAEFGIHFTLDGGKKWNKLTGGVPVIPFRDLEIQQRENDLVGASFGRSFYVLDDYSALRHVSQEALVKNELILFPVRKTRLYIRQRVLGGQKGSQGDSFFTAPNPPHGAVFTYYLRDSLKTRRQTRSDREAKIKKSAGDNPYPGFAELKQEEREDPPKIVLTITDTEGAVVNRIEGPITAGIHRIAWNMRYASPSAPGPRGPLATPGKYQVQAAKHVDDQVTPLDQPQSFELVSILSPALARQDRDAALAFQLQAGELTRKVRGALNRLEEALKDLAQIKSAIGSSPKVGRDVFDQARAIEKSLLDMKDILVGDTTRASRSQLAPLSIADRARNAYVGSLNSTYGPTKTHRREYEIGERQYREIYPRLKKSIETDLAALKSTLDAAGVSWTSGRNIPKP